MGMLYVRHKCAVHGADVLPLVWLTVVAFSYQFLVLLKKTFLWGKNAIKITHPNVLFFQLSNLFVSYFLNEAHKVCISSSAADNRLLRLCDCSSDSLSRF